MTPKRGDGQGQPGDVVITAGRPELRFEHGVLPSLPPREFQYAFDVQMCRCADVQMCRCADVLRLTCARLMISRAQSQPDCLPIREFS
jgi:hypothetical protein